jgi:hypothetical protein
MGDTGIESAFPGQPANPRAEPPFVALDDLGAAMGENCPSSVRGIEPADPPYAIAISDLLLDHERQVTRRVAQETT